MKKENSEIYRNGKLIELNNPQPEIRKNAESAKDWAYADEAVYLYRMAVLFKDRFLDPILLTDRRRLPDPVISFANLRNKNTLAAYTLVRNPQGLLYEITMNNVHYIDEEQSGKKVKRWSFGKWAQLETLLHEQVHLWQQNFGTDPVRPGQAYHNKEFINKCESLGLHPMPGAGCHTRLADGNFAILMKELGVEPPNLGEKMNDLDIDWFKWFLDSLGKGRKGTSTLHKWTCPECGLKVRIGIKGDPKIRHDPCEQKIGHPVFFVKADGITHTIYKGKK
ncbi:hypothetical protein [Pelolinea submarina]|uniref:SprT-like family protein n=1 Tax=Pelolinea submarina TaxID=913107 RepID=A0A347ZRV6_9CHLR|nr:hypothetical protein [Pelolinea submarina]REG11409.1 hypothetical protein DFR64_1290 [Pelolinea submarina]BBB48037.1 hypothetical protein Pelsub_P1265 [Pelolinea submarina]